MGYIGDINYFPRFRYLLWITDKIQKETGFDTLRLEFPDINDWDLEDIKNDYDVSLVMFTQPNGDYGKIEGESVHMGQMYFCMGRKYLIYFVSNDDLDKAIEFEKARGWHLHKRFTERYGTMLSFEIHQDEGVFAKT